MQRYISYYDLLSFEESKEILHTGDEGRLYELLFDIGFDINKEITVENLWHRAMGTKKPFLGGRFVGTERTDKEWMACEWCTTENKREQLGILDVSLLRDILEMSKEGNFTAQIIEHIKDV